MKDDCDCERMPSFKKLMISVLHCWWNMIPPPYSKLRVQNVVWEKEFGRVLGRNKFSQLEFIVFYYKNCSCIKKLFIMVVMYSLFLFISYLYIRLINLSCQRKELTNMRINACRKPSKKN